ncbi:hypothetical protein N781_14420 [Pontibacillus halophilus JSM 076056 = DSM 19796]|uniref:N-acetyltransferase domain-containing protein n=1 Tax=Pontibacillus halophilus JSM 076056 = DSM 19796 TaxID=1385510 RepID=A0A0A5GMV0_9BACI|nr:hypothetical protein N781_14420 [Pontibacillus halophilus JSM 076056 = DSM 19796]
METERLRLRKMQMSDVSKLMEIFSDHVAMKYYPSTKTVDEARNWVRWTIEHERKYGVSLWIVELKETGEFLGQCGLMFQEVEGKRELEVGYLFARRVWGNGYATEAAEACRNYAINHLLVPRVISLIDVYNEPSIRVAERIGMKRCKKILKWNKKVWIYRYEP